MALEYINLPVISYCEIPQELTEIDSNLKEASCGYYLKLKVTSKEEQPKFDDDFGVENWIIDNYPELEGKEVLIDIDY